jgi:hypothetical protein
VQVWRGVAGGPLGGQHLLRCSLGAERKLTHDDIRDALFGMLWEADYSVRREARNILPLREGNIVLEGK